MAKSTTKHASIQSLLKSIKPATAKEVKDLRTHILQVTQVEFAEIIGEGVGAVKTWEKGAQRPGRVASKMVRFLRKHPEKAKDMLVA